MANQTNESFHKRASKKFFYKISFNKVRKNSFLETMKSTSKLIALVASYFFTVEIFRKLLFRISNAASASFLSLTCKTRRNMAEIFDAKSEISLKIVSLSNSRSKRFARFGEHDVWRVRDSIKGRISGLGSSIYFFIAFF